MEAKRLLAAKERELNEKAAALDQTISERLASERANDPHGEHDFGMFDFDGRSVMFKIDYFNKDLNFHSPDPAEPAVTERVITLMLAEEY